MHILNHCKRFLFLIPIMTSIILLGAVIYLINKKDRKNDETKNNQNDYLDLYKNVEIFPEINHYDFYDDLRIKNKNAIIDETMMAKIINFVIEKAQIPNGTLVYNYVINKVQNQFRISFKWIPKNFSLKLNKNYQKTYLFTVN